MARSREPEEPRQPPIEETEQPDEALIRALESGPQVGPTYEIDPATGELALVDGEE